MTDAVTVDLIYKIALRATRMVDRSSPEELLDIMISLFVVHHYLPLDLDALLVSSKFDLVHDVWGIRRHLNRNTGRLEDCFLPRYAL